jgi:hypothetical protein
MNRSLTAELPPETFNSPARSGKAGEIIESIFAAIKSETASFVEHDSFGRS